MTAHMDEPQARRPGTVRRFFAHLRGRWRRPQTLHIYDFEEVPALMDGAGSSAVVAWQAQTSNATLALVSALIASVASVLTGVVTFLDLGGRAERHRKAAADYKGALRQLEATSFKPTWLDQPLKQESDLINQLQTTLRDIDASAPIPPRRIAERVDRMDVESRSSVFADRRNPPPRSAHAG